jgi:hypothetical protein
MATDSIFRIKAQILAEAGVPFQVLEKEIGVARRTIQRWSEKGDWKTPFKINALFEKLLINDRLSEWMMGPKGPLRVRLMYDYLVAGAVDPEKAFALACQDADRQAENWRDGAVYPVPRGQYTETTIARSNRMQELGIDPELAVRQSDTVLKRTRDDLTQQAIDNVSGAAISFTNFGEIAENGTVSLENGTPVGGLVAPISLPRATPAHFSPESPQNPAVRAGLSRSETSPLDILTRPTEQVRQHDALPSKVRQYDAVGVNDAGRCGVPVEDYVPTIGEKARAASILEVLPRDFEGFVQVVRDPESLSKAMAARSGEFQDNVSATLLKLSQYAVQLAETDPRKALVVMTQISKLAATGQKTFKLDEEKDSNKASEAMRRQAEKEEDGDAGIVLDV